MEHYLLIIKHSYLQVSYSAELTSEISRSEIANNSFQNAMSGLEQLRSENKLMRRAMVTRYHKASFLDSAKKRLAKM